MALLSERELRERVERLAAIERPSASPGERDAAESIAAELRELGLAARVEEEAAHGTYWWPLGIATAVAAVAGLTRSRVAAGLIGLGAAAAAAEDIRIGPRLLRRLLPRRRTTNVVAEIGAHDAPRTVLLIAHHDAAHAGLVFHPELPRTVARHLPRIWERIHTTPPTMWPAVQGPALVGVGALLGARRLRLLGAALSAGFAAAMADIGARRVVPGANDNLSGVAALLSLAHALADSVPAGVRVVLLSTGSEESLMEGMAGFARRHFESLPRESTYVVCLDTVGSPHLAMIEGEGMLGIRDYPQEMLDAVYDCAVRLGIYLWPGLRFRNATDGVVPLRAGYPSALLVSVDDYKTPTHYHWPTDTAANVDYGTVADAARLCHAIVERLAEGPP